MDTFLGVSLEGLHKQIQHIGLSIPENDQSNFLSYPISPTEMKVLYSFFIHKRPTALIQSIPHPMPALALHYLYYRPAEN